MVLIEDIVLSPKGYNSLQADWTGVGYAFANGLFIKGPETDGADLPFAPDKVLAFEVHDGKYDPIFLQQKIRPKIYWTDVSNAVNYRVYHTPPGGVETMIFEQPHADGVDIYEIVCPVDCPTGWNHFRVEAVDIVGNESTVEAWGHFAYDLPELPSDIEIAGSAGTFTITIAA